MSAIATAPVAQNAALNVHGMLAKLKAGEVTKPEFIAFLRSSNPNTMTVLNLVSEGVISAAEAGEFIQGQKKQNLYCKVSEKGAVSVYGLQRMPVTLYGEQWDRLMAFREQLEAFIKANRSRLSTKAAKA